MESKQSTTLQRREALIDIGLLIGVSAAAFLLELQLAELLPWGEEARGVVAVLAGALTAVVITLQRGASLADIGFRRPHRWWTVPFWALGIFILFVLMQGLVFSTLAPLFDLPPPDISRYDAVRGNLPAALLLMLVLPLTAAVPEEVMYRGFLIAKLEQVFEGRPGKALLAVLVQSLIFGSVHFQWGPGGILVTSIMGAVWGAAFLVCGRNLWIVIIAHSSAHVAMVAQIYATPV